MGTSAASLTVLWQCPQGSGHGVTGGLLIVSVLGPRTLPLKYTTSPIGEVSTCHALPKTHEGKAVSFAVKSGKR